MSKKNTKTHNIFCLDRSKIEKAMRESHMPTDNLSEQDLIKFLIDTYKVETQKEFKRQAVKADKQVVQIGSDDSTVGFSLSFYFHCEEKYNSKLANFCSDFIESDQDVFKQKPRMSSSVLFVICAVGECQT